MQLILGVLLWAVLLVGGVPRDTQEQLDRRFAWWHSRLMGTISSFVEFFCGWQMFREVLLRRGLELIGPFAAWVLGLIAFFLLCEGVIRLGITLRTSEFAAPSLIDVLAFKAIRRMRGSGELAG